MSAPDPAPHAPLSAEDAELQALERRLARHDRRRHLVGRVLLWALALGSLACLLVFFRAELTRWGRARAVQVLAWWGDLPAAGVDLEAVHARLLPAWLVAEAHVYRQGPDEANRALRRLRKAVASDAILTAYVDELAGILRKPGRLRAAPKQPIDLARQWNRYLGPRGWWIEGVVRFDSSGAQFYAKSYHVDARLAVQAGATPVTARLVARVDNLNVIETVLGHAGPQQDGALVLVDRMHDFALETIWPLLDPALDALQPPISRAFAAAVRQQAMRTLPPADFAVLQATARHRFALEQVRLDVAERAACGSTYRLRRIDQRGLTPDQLLRVRGQAGRDGNDLCPGITPNEAAQLAAASEALHATPELAAAVAALVAWLARSVTVHEVRHVADQLQRRGLEVRLPCDLCGAEMEVRSRAELSAYLAELAHPDGGAAALLQTCQLDLAPTLGTGLALHRLRAELGQGVCQAPPVDLAARATAIQRRLFGHAEVIALPSDFPVRVHRHDAP